MISANFLAQQSNPFSSQIQQILQLDGLRRDNLTLDLKEYNEGKTALDNIGTAFSSFQSVLNTFESDPGTSFQALKSTVSSDALTVISTDSSAGAGFFDIDIDQIARRDIVSTSTFSDTGTELSGTGSGSFSLSVGEETIDINIDTSGLTNREVLDEIVTAISEAGVENLSVSRLQVNDTESVLSVKSGDTGSANKISIQNLTGDLQSLDFTHLHQESELDAQFTIDGVSFTRSSNIVDDAIEGVTFELAMEDTGNQQLTVSQDSDKVIENIESFVEAYNKLNATIRNNTFLNSETGNRGPLQRERSIRNLSNSMRQTFLLPVESLQDGPISLLADIGISFKQDGAMAIEDTSTLESVIAQNSDSLNQLFTAPDGLIATIRNGIESSFSGSGNLLETIESGFDSRIERTNNRIEREERFLIRREAQLIAEFSQLSQIITDGQNQFNQVMNFQSSLGIGF